MSKPKNYNYYMYYQKQGAHRTLSEVDFKHYMMGRVVPMNLNRNIVKELNPYLNGKRLLDVGCGQGWNLYSMVGKCSGAIGIDISFGHLLQAHELLKTRNNISLVQGDVSLNLPFDNQTVDIALMADVIEHLVTPKVALEEIKRVLKTDGRVLICAPSILHPSEWQGRIINIFRGHFRDHLHFYTPKKLKQFIELAGFKTIKLSTCCFLPTIFSGKEIKTNLGRKIYNTIEEILSKVPGVNMLGSSIILVMIPESEYILPN